MTPLPLLVPLDALNPKPIVLLFLHLRFLLFPQHLLDGQLLPVILVVGQRLMIVDMVPLPQSVLR